MPDLTFNERFTSWLRTANPDPPIPAPPPIHELIAGHPNPIGKLDWAKRALPHSMPIGVDRQHKMIYTKERTSCFWVGPAQAMGGKSSSGTVPILLEHNGPAGVMSLRTDALRTTVALRSLRGAVFMLDPDGVGIPEGVAEVRWSLVVGADRLDNALKTAKAMVKSAHAIHSKDGSGEAQHFLELAGTVLGLLCHYTAMTGRDFRWVHGLCASGDLKVFDQMLDFMEHWEGDPRAFHKLKGVLNSPGDRERGSILTTLNVAMMAYDTEDALRSSDSPNFDPAEFVKGSKTEENSWLWTDSPERPGHGTGDTLYLIRGDNKMAAAINVAIVTQMIEARYRLYREDENAGDGDAHPDVLFCLDEMANMPLPDLPEYLATPGRGVLFTGMLQDFSQLRAKWGALGDSMLTQMQQLIIFRGERVKETLQLIEAMCPTSPVERVISAPNHQGGAALGASATAERLPGIPMYRIYSGVNDDPTVVLYLGADGAPPDWIHIRPYYSDPMLLNVQVKALYAMAKKLDPNDVRRLLPLPNLDRKGTGLAILQAGGQELLSQYREAVRLLGKPDDTQEVLFA